MWVLWDYVYRGPKDLRVAKVPFVWTLRRFFVGLVWACLVLLLWFVCVAFCVWFCYCIVVCLFVCLFVCLIFGELFRYVLLYTWTLKSTKKLERLEFQSVWATWSTSRQNWTVPNKTERQAFAFSMAACSCVKWAQVWHHRSAIRWFFSKLSISNCLAYWPRHFSRIYQTISANQGMNGTRTTFFGDTQLAKSFHGIP